jgi:hypothetical protein
MAQAKHHSTTNPLSTLFRDPYVRAAFEAAERDGLAPALVETDRPRTLDGGAIVRPELVEA